MNTNLKFYIMALYYVEHLSIKEIVLNLDNSYTTQEIQCIIDEVDTDDDAFDKVCIQYLLI